MSTKILVVDDDPVVGILVNEYLSAHGYEIEVLNSGTKALETLKDKMPDVLILDLIMPDMTGIDVLKKIRDDSRTSALPVIMLSANNDTGSIVAGYSISANMYVEKPFNVKQILGAIKELVEAAQKQPSMPNEAK